MQWRVILAGVIILAVILGGLFSYRHIYDTCGEISRLLETSLDGLDPADPHVPLDATEVEEANRIWEDHQTYFSVMLPHDHLYQVSLSFARTLGYFALDNREEYYSSLKELLRTVQIIAEFDQLNWRNIL